MTAGGRRQRLDWVVTEERRTAVPTDLGTGQVFHYSIPMLDEIGDGCLESPQDIGSAKLMLSGGEVLISKLNPRIPRVVKAVSHDVPTVASTEFIALRPSPKVDERFLRFWLASDPVHQYLDGATMSVTRSQQRVRPDVLTKMWVRFPSVPEQGAIADYLDAETARIDALIAKKRTLSDKIEERSNARADWLITRGGSPESIPAGWRWVPARRLCRQITVGVVVNPSSYFVDHGVPFIHGTDVRRGWIDESTLKFLSSESNALLRKSQIHVGDVLAMRVGEPGRSAVVPPHLDGANCASVLIFRKSAALQSEILCAFLNGRVGRSQIEAMQYGAAQGVFNVSDALDLRVPVPPPADQVDIVNQLRRDGDVRVRASRLLGEQISRLREYRQALITAAVTGELEIPVVA